MKHLSILLLIVFFFASCLSSDNEDDKKENNNDDGENTSLVDTATVHSDILSFTPNHNASNVSIQTSITIQFTDIDLSNKRVYVELFGVDANKTNCRIDQEGFKCGSLSGTDSFYELYGAVKADPANGIEGKTGEIVHGSAIVNSNNSLTVTMERDLIDDIKYVVHVYYDSEDGTGSFKTWWIFKT